MAKEKAQYGVIEGTLVYAKIAQADSKYQSKDTEYSVEVIISEDQADAWDEQFKKQPAKKIKAADFEAKYKIPVPSAFKGEKNLYSIKLKKDAVVDGEEFFPEYAPKVYLETADERVDITKSRLIANGSFGKVSYRINSNDFGTFAKLANVLLDEEGFIEYESKSTGGPGAEFGSAKPVRQEAPSAAATQARKPREEVAAQEAPKAAGKPVKAAPKANVDFIDDDIPFNNPFRGRLSYVV